MVYQRRRADGTLLVMTGEDEENKGSHIRIPIFGNAIFNSTMKISVDAHGYEFSGLRLLSLWCGDSCIHGRH